MASRRLLSSETITTALKGVEADINDRLASAPGSASIETLSPLFDARRELLALASRGTERKAEKPRVAPRTTRTAPIAPVPDPPAA